MSGLRLGVTDSNNAKDLKKEIRAELMLVAWHPQRWWDCCMPEHGRKIEPYFINGK